VILISKRTLKKASKITNRAILFNIQGKADGFDNSENFSDRVLMVFLKALNESYGYHPIYPEIAEIERQLDQNGLFEKFKDNYYKHCNHRLGTSPKRCVLAFE
jgi:hypothetical protein